MKTIALGILLAALLGAAGTWLAIVPDDGPATVVTDPQRDALPVRTMELEKLSAITRDREFAGTVLAARRSRLAFQRSARLMKVLVDEGQSIAAGDVLAVIDQRQLSARVTELEAGIQQQQAFLKELTEGPRKQTIASMQANLDAMSADVDLQKATLDRTQGLFRRKATSAQALDEVQLAWKASVARRDSVARQLDELNAGTRQEKIDAQDAVLTGLKAQLSQLQIDVTDSELKAPFAGTVVKRFADEGDMLSMQQPVLELLETSNLEAHVGVPSSLVSTLERDAYFVLTSGNQKCSGRIRDVLSQVDPQTRTQTVILSILESDSSGLADGALVRLSLQETQAVEGFQVPLTALASGSRGLWTLYVVEAAEGKSRPHGNESIIAPRAVEVLHTDGDSAVVRGAVYEGETIVADGVHRVVSGQRVTIQPTAAEEG